MIVLSYSISPGGPQHCPEVRQAHFPQDIHSRVYRIFVGDVARLVGQDHPSDALLFLLLFRELRVQVSPFEGVVGVEAELHGELPPAFLLHYCAETLPCIFEDPLHVRLMPRQATYGERWFEQPQGSLHDEMDQHQAVSLLVIGYLLVDALEDTGEYLFAHPV